MLYNLKTMKKVFFFFLLILILNNEYSNAESIINYNVTQGYIITVKSEEINDSYIYLSRRLSGSWDNIDSALFIKGKDVSFNGELESPEVLYLRLENSEKPVSFFAENSEIIILPDFGNPRNTIVEGSAVQKELELYESIFTELNAEQDLVYQEYMNARKEKDEEKMKNIIARLDEFAAKEMEMNKNYISSHRSSFVSPYIIRSKMYYTLSLDELKNLVYGLDNSISNSIYVKQLKEHISVLEKVAIGQKFTDFELPAPGGELMSLSDVVGENYVLIDFWASWCGPCRRENPNVVRIFNEYHDKGFDIFGVSFDTSRDNWLKAVDDDKLSWHHVSDLNGWANAAGKLYGINSIPHTVLLDPDGTIVARNLSSEELEKKLAKLLGK